MQTRKTVSAAIAVVLALSLSACGDDDEKTETAPALGVIDQLASAIEDGGEVARQIKVQDLIAECMVEAGFDYTPVDYSSLLDAQEDVPQWDTLDFAKEYGYGITTDIWGLDEADTVDPNEEYVAAMSETEAEAYYYALLGENVGGGDVSADDDEEGYDSEVEAITAEFENAGCTGKAYNQVNTEWLGENGEFMALQAEMSRVGESILEDPEVVDRNSAWADCMADAGYAGYLSPQDPQADITARLDDIYADSQNAWETIDYETATEADFDAITDEQEARVSDLRDEEIATATADYTCRQDSGWQDAYEAVNIRVQQEFYDTHKEEVDAFFEHATQNLE